MSDANRQVATSAPASLMVLGEYAVLHGYPAIVMAVNQRIHVTIRSQNQAGIRIQSALGEFNGPANDLSQHAALNYIHAAIQQFTPALDKVCIQIDSDFSHLLGLGSSAAVTTAMLAALTQWHHHQIPQPQHLHQMAMDCLAWLNKSGSGADMAASIYGGVLAYQAKQLTGLTLIDGFFIVYSGQKASTDDALHRIQSSDSQQHSKIYQKIGDCCRQGITAIQQNNREQLAHCMNQQHQYLCELGTSTKNIDQIVHQLKSDDSVDAVKISGAGFGDCLLGLHHSHPLPPLHQAPGDACYISATADPNGVQYEST